MDAFRREVAEHRKTGFLAIFTHDVRCQSVEEELSLLGTAMRQAGMTDDQDALIAGKTLATAIEVPCPVTGKDTLYEFFSVAFCRNAANQNDPLYDPSLSLRSPPSTRPPTPSRSPASSTIRPCAPGAGRSTR
jgi:hypothetical protein